MTEQWAQAEQERKQANMLRLGRVVELDAKAARVRVAVSGTTTTWIPWASANAGGVRTWAPPQPGEQVMVLAPDGDFAQAVVAGSVYQDNHPAPADNGDVTATVFSDGAAVSYDRAAHKWSLTVPGGGSASVDIGGVTLDISPGRVVVRASQVVIDGDLSVTGDVTAGTVSLRSHLHTGVMSGPALTGPPKT